MSLRLRLTLFFTIVLAASLLAFSALLYVMLDHTLALDLDSAIASKAEDVARTSRIRGEFPLRRRRISLPNVDAFAAPEVYIQLLDAEGRVVDRSANLSDHQLPLTETALAQGRQGSAWFDTLELDGQSLRLYTAPVSIEDDVIGFIQVARSVEDNAQTLAHVQRLLLICDVLVVAGAAFVGWVLARHSLRPIDRVTQTARAIGLSGSLERRLAPESRGDEVGRLVATFNEMLDRLETAFVAQRRFVADASHELRTPLTTIRGNAELLRRVPDLPREEVEEALADIVSEAQRMSRLVTELLRLARADAGIGLELTPVRLVPVLRGVERQMQQHRPGVTVRFLPDPPLAPGQLGRADGATDAVSRPDGERLVLGSRDALQELFLILVDNGLKYTPEGGEVVLRLSRQPDGQVVEVRDNGSGIAAEDLPHIFERFYRARTARPEGGTGLGLAIARWIVDQHGGRISVASELGHGSTFTVWLPSPPDLVPPAAEDDESVWPHPAATVGTAGSARPAASNL